MRKLLNKIYKAIIRFNSKHASYEVKLKKKLVKGEASPEEALKLYELYKKSGKNFPLEFEEKALEVLINQDPKRTDLTQRLKQVKQLLNKSVSANSSYEKNRRTESIDILIRTSKPVFIIGCGRSGTTMLFRLLSNAEELEPTIGFPDGEDHIGWLQHGGAIISGLGHESYESGIVGFNACLHMDGSYVSDDIINRLHEYYYYDVLNGQSNKRVLNKCPHLSNKIDYVRKIFPDAKFIHIVRDCLPVVASWVEIMKAVPDLVLYWPETEYPCFWAMRLPEYEMVKNTLNKTTQFYPGAGPEFFVDYWCAVNTDIKRQLPPDTEQLLTVRYEDVCENPQEELKKICEFIGIKETYNELYRDIPIQRKTNEKYMNVLSNQEQILCINKAKSVRNIFGYL